MIAAHEIRPFPHWPVQDHAIAHGGRSSRTISALQGLGDAEKFARIDDAHDDLLPLRRHLRDAQAALEKNEEISRFIALLDYVCSGTEGPPDGGAMDVIEINLCQVGENGQTTYLCFVDYCWFGLHAGP